MLWEAKETEPGIGAVAMPIDDAWKLTFDEEFNGSALDTSKWVPNWLGNPSDITKPINSAEIAAYAPGMVAVSGGLLHLKADGKDVTATDGKTYSYRSGCIQSNNAFRQAYGYFECKLNCPASSGTTIANWPAFWLNGQNWPTDGEIDVFEGLNGKAAFHFHCTGGDYGQTVPGDYTGWHTYGVMWVPGKLDYYYDGNRVGTLSQGITAKPMYLIVNYGLGGYGGPLLTPSELQCEYVRAWSNDPNAVAVPPQPGYQPPPAAGGGGGSSTEEQAQDAAIQQLQADVAQLKTDVTTLDGRLDKVASGAVG